MAVESENICRKEFVNEVLYKFSLDVTELESWPRNSITVALIIKNTCG